jgi:hypothetical protein
METWQGSILSRYSRPHGMAGMDSEQILGSCNAAGMHLPLSSGPNYLAGMNET